MTSNATDSSKRSLDDANNSLERIKLDPKNYSVLQLFVESEWEKNAIKYLGEWLCSRNEDNARFPFFTREKDFKDRLTSELNNILPFLIKCNDDVKYTDENGQTILHVYLANSESNYRGWYTRSNSEVKIFWIVRTLIDRGASVNAPDKYGKTPLHIAAETRKLKILRLMLDFFGNADVCDEKGNTVLHTVVEENIEEDDHYLDVVKTLLAKGVDPNRRNKAGTTALEFVIGNCNVDLLRIFKKNGADFRELTNNNENLLLLAYKNTRLDEVRNTDDFDVAESMLLKITDFLVDLGCDVNLQDNDGYSPVHLAFRWPRVLRKLIELGADVHCQTRKERQTPLHLAVALKDMHACAVLLDVGASSGTVDIEGQTMLDVALKNDDLEMIEVLLNLGVDVNNRSTIDQWGTCNRRARKLVIGQAFKLKMIQFPVHKAYENSLKEKGGWSKLRECYSREVSKMKTLMISDRVSIYQFLLMDSRRQLAYVDCLPRDFKSKFHFYGNFIQRIRNAAILRNQLVQSAEVACYEITKRSLPDICVERILHFLNNGDLRRLIDAAECTTGI